MSRRLTKKSLVKVPGRLVKTPKSVCPKFALSARRPPTRTVISGAVSVSRFALSTSNSAADAFVSLADVVAEAVRGRLEHGEGGHIGLLLRGIGAAWREGNLHVVASLLCCLLDGCRATENNQVGKRDFFAARLRAVEFLLDRLQR